MHIVLLAAVAAGIALGGLSLALDPLVRTIGGSSSHAPEELDRLGPGARELINRAFADQEPQSLFDYHTHILGLGTGGTGAAINESMKGWSHPIQRLRALTFFSGAGIEDEKDADREYVERLLRLVRATPGHGRHAILAFDHAYRRDGSIDHEASEFYVPNDYVMRLAADHPDAFVPVVSVHPWRKDALEELERWAEQGARIVKWLPNAQGMDASEPAIDDYYRLMARHRMVLLTHVGEEKAVHSASAQGLGNPLLFRRPLDLGVRVVMAHAASLGDNPDLDHPGHRADNFDLLLRLFEEPRYQGLLFADISAVTQFNRLPRPLLELLRRTDLHGRLVNGSDYPLPALNVMVQTRALVDIGVITAEERRNLNEIFDVNPLLFDYVVKRTLRHPETGTRFPASVFTAHPALGPASNY